MTDTNTASDPLQGQPYEIVERDGVRFTLLGTAHVSRASVDAVRAAVASGDYDSVAVELDAGRLQSLTDPDTLARLDLVKVIREGKTHLFAANLALAAYQRRLAEQLGVEPGEELKAGALDAQARGLPVHLIDREVGLTFKRALQSLGWWQRTKVGAGILASMFADEEVGDDEIEKLKQGDMLESSFGEFATESPQLYSTIIAERDQYMASALRQVAANAPTGQGSPYRVLAVVGAGHLPGLVRHLKDDAEDPAQLRRSLETVKPKSRMPWMELIIGAFLVGGFAWGFWQGGVDVGSDLLVQWVLATGLLGALGCAIAGGHPLSILAAFIASPLTPLHPALASGTVSAFVEATLRKPTYADFMALRDDVQTTRGWWKNRVARVLLNFFLTSLGTAIGVWTGGLRMLGKLVG
ncbi:MULTISPECIES: TraB/GumN family protein [unclassified Pseudoxanthomonas]|uniref:TraB/GumN family protein n=1 Tax=unclassified Pseudoxanthomonas TaxID=2645906 RepID=UPI0008EC4CF9|nr:MULTISPECIES: TraB/GumN family protein [unclassified Pseudoxanthomonas]PPJ42801.1 TraB family protein [Pseudoxanthomonas sp. KAs_5_3]SFV26272.1 pheromone shutdown-related protein TraB [Pseudoxanthomonas sp. YR558]